MTTAKAPAVRPSAVPEPGHAQRAAGLLAQAKAEATQLVAEAMQTMGNLAAIADDIAIGGAVYPPAVRDEMSRLGDHLNRVAERVAVIMDRQP